LIIIRRNSKRLLHLINQLLEVRRIKTGIVRLNVQESNLIKFLEGIVHSFELLAAQKNIHFEFLYYPESIMVFFDKEKVENIIYNLLSNAFKYTPVKGNISINVTVSGQDNIEEGDVCIIGLNAHKKHFIKEFVEIKVQDDGPGIPNNQIHNIFKRFYRIPSSNIDVEGSGIGLYLTRELIKIHYGILVVNSDIGKGTVFKVRLPMGRDFLDNQPIDSVQYDDYPANQKLHIDLLSEQITINENKNQTQNILNPLSESNFRPTILFIDDDKDLSRYIEENLIRSFNVITANNGKEGLSKVNEILPDAVITDIVMPEMDGLDLCQSIKSNILISHIPVIILSSRSEISDYMNGLNLMADDYLSKPFNLEILEAKINSLIKNRINLKKIFSSVPLSEIHNAVSDQSEKELLNKILIIVEKNMSNPKFGVKDLASTLSMSHSLLSKKLNSLVNQSPNEFINSIRLKKAAMLLMDRSVSVTQVAFKVGYDDPKYFSRSFRKFFGKSPSYY